MLIVVSLISFVLGTIFGPKIVAVVKAKLNKGN